MDIRQSPPQTDVLVLCGGLGTRLRQVVSDRPKPMADIGGRPFLEILVDYISGFGFRRFIFCTGYMADSIKAGFKSRTDIEPVFSYESEPLGTGGAVRLASPHIRSESFMVVNGDSFCRADLEALLRFHLRNDALVTMTMVTPEEGSDYGAVTLDESGRVVSFAEKTASKGYINAGMYLFKKEALELIPAIGVYSLERDLFPRILDRRVYGFISSARLLDIGTPERYNLAQESGLPGL